MTTTFNNFQPTTQITSKYPELTDIEMEVIAGGDESNEGDTQSEDTQSEEATNIIIRSIVLGGKAPRLRPAK